MTASTVAPAWAHAGLLLAFILHIAGGTIGLVSGTVAAFAHKGGPLHRAAGTVFFVSMLVMAVFAIVLAVIIPGQIGNLLGGSFTIYLVLTAWLTVRRKEGTIGVSEKIALAVSLLLLAPFILLAFVQVTGTPVSVAAVVTVKGPVVIAMYTLTFIAAAAALGDLSVVLRGGIRGAARIARHLWRMCLGLTFATGSAFTNGFPRLLPGPMHFSNAYFLPMLLPIGLLVFWMIRVRLTSWYKAANLR